MAIKIGFDSCCDFDKGFDTCISTTQIPITIDFDGTVYTSDAALDLDKYFEHMRTTKTFKTACPPIQTFLDFMEQGDEDVFIVTMSHKISATADVANLAREAYYEKGGNKKVHVFNTLAASSKQTAVVDELIRLCKQNLNFEQIITDIDKFIDDTDFYFLPESMDNLVKGGRANEEIAKAAAAANIRIITYLNKQGAVTQAEKCFGQKNALKRLSETIAAKQGIQDRTVYISQCFAEDHAEYLANQIRQMCGCNNIIIQKAGSISSLYCGFGGILVCF